MMEATQRKIIHIDMDAFFASVEQRDNPELKGKCVVVGGSPQSRGVVCAASYEAREFGVRSAMASSIAYKLCPHAVFLSPSFQKYKDISLKLKEIFLDYTDLIEPLSLDEAYLDVTNNKINQASASIIAKEIKNRIQSELSLVASCGIASNKLLAKIASDYKKPNGFFVIKPEKSKDFMKELLINKVPGVGKATLKKLTELKVEYCKDLLNYSQAFIEKEFGKFGKRLYLNAQGIDNRPVKVYREAKSIGSEKTLSHDSLDINELQEILLNEIRQVTQRLEYKKLSGRTITLKVKYYDFTQVTRSITLTRSIFRAEDIFNICKQLIKKTLIGKKKVRLIGVSLSNFQEEHPQQLLLDF